MRYVVQVEVYQEGGREPVAWGEQDVEADNPEDALLKAEITLYDVGY